MEDEISFVLPAPDPTAWPAPGPQDHESRVVDVPRGPMISVDGRLLDSATQYPHGGPCLAGGGFEWWVAADWADEQLGVNP